MDVIDLVAREAHHRLENLIPVLIDAALRGEPVELVADPTAPAVDVKSDAGSRAWRTLAQGAVATVITAGAGAVATAVAVPGFDLLDWGSWSGAFTTAGTAVVMAGLAYLQRQLGR